MHLKRLEIENFKKIENFEQDFTGDIYFFRGDNEVGKSTLLESIFTLLTANRHDTMLTNGKEKGFVRVFFSSEKGDYEVELKYSNKNQRGSLSITKDGMKANTVSALQAIFGYEDFDASEFIALSQTVPGRRKQVEIIKSLLTEDEQLEIDKCNSIIKESKEERTQYNTNVDFLKKAIKSIGIDDDFITKYSEPLNASSILSEIDKAKKSIEENKKLLDNIEQLKTTLLNWDSHVDNSINELNSLHYEKVKKLESWDLYRNNQLEPINLAIDSKINKISDNEKEILRLKEAINKLEASNSILEREKQELIESKDSRLNSLSEEKKQLETFMSDAKEDKQTHINDEKCKIESEILRLTNLTESFKDPKIEELEVKLDSIQEHNDNVLKVVDYKAKIKEHDDNVNKINALNYKIENAEESKKNTIINSSLPIKGLTIGEDGLLLNDIPFISGRVSTSQEMEVALQIVLAKNTKTKMVRVARAESLGGQKMKSIIDFARNNGYQGFFEQVVPFKNSLEVWEYTEK